MYTPHLLALCLSLAALPGHAQQAMSPAAFEAYVTGKTITYERDGTPFGEEQYYPNRKVIWAFDGDTCTFGDWYPAGEYICFAYDGQSQDQCWQFWLTDRGRLAALVQGGTPDSVLLGTRETEAHIQCPLPGLGS